MNLSIAVNEAQRWMSAVYAKATPWRVARVVALSGLLAAATVMYFGMTSGDELEVSSPVAATEAQMTVSSEVTPLAMARDSRSGYDDDAWQFDSPYYEDFSQLGSLQTQDLLNDAWMFDSPYYEDFRN